MRLLGPERTVRRPSVSDRRSSPMPALPRPTLRKVAHRIADEDASRPLWRHPVTIAAAALALTLGAVPLLPDGGQDDAARSRRPPRRPVPPAPSAAAESRPRCGPRSTACSPRVRPSTARRGVRRSRRRRCGARPSRASATASASAGPTSRRRPSRHGWRPARRLAPPSAPATWTPTGCWPAPSRVRRPLARRRSAPS